MIEVQIEIPGNLNAHCSIRPWFYKAERLQSATLEDRPFKDLGFSGRHRRRKAEEKKLQQKIGGILKSARKDLTT